MDCQRLRFRLFVLCIFVFIIIQGVRTQTGATGVANSPDNSASQSRQHNPSELGFIDSVEVLGNSRGFNFVPYLQENVPPLEQNWCARIPPELSTGQPREVIVEFDVARDGKISRVKLTNPSGYAKLDEAATDAVVSAGALAPLPREYKKRSSALRAHLVSQRLPPGVFRIKDGVTAPRGVYLPDPVYPEAARRAKYQATVPLNVIIGADGGVRDARVLRSLGLGMDEAALAAVKTWKFEPATKDGVPVAVLVTVDVEFRLK